LAALLFSLSAFLSLLSSFLFPQDSDLDDINKMDCANSSKLSAEATNLARYSRLIHEVGPGVMASIFRASYQKEYGKPWTPCSGDSFLHNKFSDGSNSLWHFGTQYVNTFSAGKCEEWDVSLLCSLLLNVPGYVKGTQAEKAVRRLRRERNRLVHVLEAKKVTFRERIQKEMGHRFRSSKYPHGRTVASRKKRARVED